MEDKISIIREYMREMAMRSVAKQKSNPNKMSEMGKKAGIVRRQRAEIRKRKILEDMGEAVDVVLK